MNLDYFKSNIKFTNLKSFKLKFFPGTFVRNYNANILIFDGNLNNKKIITYPMLLEKIESEFYIFENNFKKNSFYMYSGGFNFFDNTPINEKIIFICPCSNGLSANIFTSIISVKLIDLIKNKHNNILSEKKSNESIESNDDFKSKFTYLNKYSEELIIKIFGFSIKYNDKNIIRLIYSDYVKKIFEIEDNLKKDDPIYLICLKLLEYDIKINFIINLIFKFNKNFTSDNLINFYYFLFENIDKIDLIKANSINNFFNSNIIADTECFDNIIFNWFIYIGLCQKSIRLLNIINIVNNKSIEELSEKKINKNKIIDFLINSQTQTMFKFSKSLID
jgi:hypothetical protein